MNQPFKEVMNNISHTQQPVITLLTDFGVADGFIGVMKGVMLQICPAAWLVDISHDLPRFSIEAGAFLNQWSYGYFPQGTVHLCVVDPGVGTSRRMLAVEVSGHYFIAPDNGVLSPMLQLDGRKRIVSITNQRYWLDKVSHTFHGRDIFSPVAAHIAAGVPIDDVGQVVDDPVMLPPCELSLTNESIVCAIEYIDRFGNLITTLSGERYQEWLEQTGLQNPYVQIHAGDYIVKGISSSYGEKNKGELLAVFDGYNRLEVSVNQGSAQEMTGLQYGDSIFISLMNG